MPTAPHVPDPKAPDAIGGSVAALSTLTRLLRVECPWDRAQTAGTIVPHTLEEVWEVVDAVHDAERAIANGSPPDLAALEDELGDLLFQVAFLSMWCNELDPSIDLGSVARGIVQKLVRRHPHVFGSAVADTADDVRETWEQVKRTADDRPVFGGIPRSMPPLSRARKSQARAGAIGFDFQHVGEALAKVEEEVGELREALDLAAARGAVSSSEERAGDAHVAAEVGDLLFATVSIARLARVDTELALDGCTRRFEDRVTTAMALSQAAGRPFSELDLIEQEQWYQQAKRELESRG